MMKYQYIKDIKLVNFRNILEAELEFSKGINIIYGENAQGKTNFLEGLWLLTGGKSFRGAKDTDMVGFDYSVFRVEGNVGDGEDEKNITILCSSDKNAKHKGRVASLQYSDIIPVSEVVGNCYCVIFSPVHLNIVSGGPALRRKFMDACLCQMSPYFIDSYKEYTKTLNVRNAFLKNFRKYDLRQAESISTTLNKSMADYGYEIYRFRKDFCEFLAERRAMYYDQISGGKEKLEIKYSFFSDNKERMIELLMQNHFKDVAMGYTTAGVHREDIEIYLNGLPAKDFASQGQQRSIVIAMKLAESDIMEKMCGVSPVILLDDVLSELDFSRQDYLLNNISGKQVFITSCDIDRIKKSDSKKFYVENGTITECT